MGTKFRPYGARGVFRLLGAVCCVVLLAACSSYHGQSAVIKKSLLDEDYPAALESLEKIDQGKSGLLYYYEKGLIHHYQNDYVASNQAFDQAEILLDELYTKSVTRELAALAVTDNITKYRGEPFEAILVNYYKILNYLYLRDTEGALVECRRVNFKLQMLIDSGETYFTNDPFLQYLTGMVYQAAGDYTDAEVSFRVAAEAYEELRQTYGVQTPATLFCDAAKTARVLGDAEAAESYAAKTDCPEAERNGEIGFAGAAADSVASFPERGYGTLNLFLECGYVPHKEEENIVLPIYVDDDPENRDEFAAKMAGRRGAARRSGIKVEYLLRIALPILSPTPVPFEYAVIRPYEKVADSEKSRNFVAPRTVLVENIDALAHHAFKEREGRILLRTIIRGLTKYAAKKGAENKNEGLGLLVNVLGVVTESADTRSWSTLPEKILMGRLLLPEGTYDLKVELYDGGGRLTNTITIVDVDIQKGQTSFLNHRVF